MMPTIAPTLKNAQYYKVVAQGAVDQYFKIVTPAAKDSEYLQVLRQNTERLQGSLVLIGYDLQGGEDAKMIAQAALAIEILHAFVLCMDQGVDHEQALRAQHEAQIILANLETSEENRLKALSITNRTLMLATLARLHGTSKEDALNWQATELTLNPLHVGQVLASADCHATNAVTPLAMQTGRCLAKGEAVDIQSFVQQLATL